MKMNFAEFLKNLDIKESFKRNVVESLSKNNLSEEQKCIIALILGYIICYSEQLKRIEKFKVKREK